MGRSHRLRGKRAVVTGGSNGIGRAIVETYIREGADVFFTILTDKAAAREVEHLGAAFGVRTKYINVNATRAEHAADLFQAAVEFHGRVDILVNNAAVATRSAFLDTTPAEFSRVLDTNLQFPFFATQLFARYMVQEAIPGSIINISSISAFKAISAMAHYQCSKAALTMLTRSAAFELAPYKIRVNSISPGLTATKANRDQWRDDPEVWKRRGSGIPLGRTGTPNDHAGAAVFLASDESLWMTGADLVIDGGESVI